MPWPAVQLDHIVIHLPYQQVRKPPDWITDNFVLSPGGKHADGRTENRLVFFHDGTYLEIIAFVKDDPARRQGHWCDTEYGIVNFALTTTHPFDRARFRDRLEASRSGVCYAGEPTRGGRTSVEGKSMTWDLTFPQEGVECGLLPFWCHDITPRENRVPATDGNARHPCGAVGIAGVLSEIAGDDQYERVEAALPAITGASCRQHADARFEVGTPFDIGRLQCPTIRLKRLHKSQQSRLVLVLQSPRKDGQKDIDEWVGEGRIIIRFET